MRSNAKTMEEVDNMSSYIADEYIAVVWTAMDILTALALKKGWMTARVGRPDISRAGNFSQSSCFPWLRNPYV